MGRTACLSPILFENELEVILKLIITIKLVNFHALCRADFVDGLLLPNSVTHHLDRTNGDVSSNGNCIITDVNLLSFCHLIFHGIFSKRETTSLLMSNQVWKVNNEIFMIGPRKQKKWRRGNYNWLTKSPCCFYCHVSWGVKNRNCRFYPKDATSKEVSYLLCCFVPHF